MLELKLEKKLEPLPADTTVRMRSQSTLGGNYVELVPGRSKQPLAAHAAGDPRRGRPEAGLLSDSLSAYDKRTRAFARYLGGGGDDSLVGAAPRSTA